MGECQVFMVILSKKGQVENVTLYLHVVLSTLFALECDLVVFPDLKLALKLTIKPL